MSDNIDNKPFSKAIILVLPPVILGSAVLAGLSVEQAEATTIGWYGTIETMQVRDQERLSITKELVSPGATATLAASISILAGGVTGVRTYRRSAQKRKSVSEGAGMENASNSQSFDGVQQDIAASPSKSKTDSCWWKIVIAGSLLVSILWVIVLSMLSFFYSVSEAVMFFLYKFLVLVIISFLPAMVLSVLIGKITRKITMSNDTRKTDVPDDTTTENLPFNRQE